MQRYTNNVYPKVSFCKLIFLHCLNPSVPGLKQIIIPFATVVSFSIIHSVTFSLLVYKTTLSGPIGRDSTHLLKLKASVMTWRTQSQPLEFSETVTMIAALKKARAFSDCLTNTFQGQDLQLPYSFHSSRSTLVKMNFPFHSGLLASSFPPNKTVIMPSLGFSP